MDEKTFKTLLLQFRHLACANPAVLVMLDILEEEYHFAKIVDLKPANQKRQNLYKILHSTRMLDSGMKAFLQIYNEVPNERSEWTMGGYLKVLKKGGNGKFTKLNQRLSQRFQDNIVGERNRLLHAAGQYPSPKDTSLLQNDIVSAMQTILNLAKP